MKKKHLFNAALLWAFLSLTLWTTGCSDDDGYPDVDGQAPSIEMTLEHIQTANGRTFTLEGTIKDADGISTIQLQCADLNLNKTIDLIEIYEKPLETYELSYDFKIQPDEIGEQFTVKVTVTDVGGRTVSQDVLVTLDGDFEDPVFVIAPEKGGMVTVLLREGEIPTLNMNISITDDRGLDYLLVNIEGIEGYENLNMAKAYSSIGKFYRDITTDVTEADDKGKYKPFFDNINALLNSIAKDTSESEIVRLELLELARNAISQYATKFKGDGVTKSEISDMYYLIRDTLEDIETTTEKTTAKKNGTKSLLFDTKKAIDAAYSTSKGGAQ